jgi:hypothetical protein
MWPCRTQCTFLSLGTYRTEHAGEYKGTSFQRKRTSLGPCSRTMPRALRLSEGGELFLMREAPLCSDPLLFPRLDTHTHKRTHT